MMTPNDLAQIRKRLGLTQAELARRKRVEMLQDSNGERLMIGDRIVLSYFISSDIPKRLAGTRGTIRDVSRAGKLIIKADDDSYGTRSLWPQNVTKVRGMR